MNPRLGGVAVSCPTPETHKRSYNSQLSARTPTQSFNMVNTGFIPFVDLTEQGYDSDTNTRPLTIEDLVGPPAATPEPFSDDESTINPAGDDAMDVDMEVDLEDGFQTPIRNNNQVIPDPPVLVRTYNNYRDIVNIITPPETYNMILPLYDRQNNNPYDENRLFGHQPVVRNLINDF